MPAPERTRHPLRRQEATRREGSPWTGLGAVLAKEMADHLTSVRMRILEALILLTAGGTVYSALQTVRSAGNEEFLYLRLFTSAQEPLPSFVSLLGLLVPLIAIALAFDAINGEHNRRTMSRLLAQPIYRDALLMGKFLGGLFTLVVFFATIWLLIFGLGILGMGVPPEGEETARALWFLVATIFYGGIWLAVGMLFSIQFRSPATAALSSIAVWLFFTVFWSIIAGLLAQALLPQSISTVDELLRAANLKPALQRFSPNVLYAEVTIILLQPTIRSLGIVLPIQLDRALMGTPLPLGESLAMIWPHLTGLIAATILLFALGYILFQRQEIRA